MRTLFAQHPELRDHIDAPVFAFDAPAIVAFANDAALVDVLLEFGADPNRRSNWWAGGFHALYSAVGSAAERLLAAGAIPDACAAAHLGRVDLLNRILTDDPARVHERGGDGQLPLHFATSREIVDLLLDAGADLDARDIDHRATAAEWMLAGSRGAGRYELARYLVQRGATTDIFLATALGLTDAVRPMLEANPTLLAQRTDAGDYGEKPPSSHHIYYWTIGAGRSPLDVAVQFGQHDTLRAMLEFASPLQRFVLACRRGDERSATALLREHPALVASMSPADHRAITDSAWHGDAAAVAMMLTLGFDPRTPGQDSGTALHCAAWQGSADTVAVLLRSRDATALLAAREPVHGGTPLDWCLHGSRFGDRRHDHATVAQLLLEAGARLGPDSGEGSPSVNAVLAAWRSSTA
ncbi:MAG: ankyrin repeat domain-containing protein [bacterium]